MKKNLQKQDSKYLLWPLIVLAFLTIGVFFTASQVPKQQELRSHAQVFQNPSLFAQDFSTPDTDTPTPTPPPPAPKGVDATINIPVSLPGNSSSGAHTNPIHQTRNIT